ncbi:hypothetical protein PIB30_077706, partial [Stylosanthes scabra]|nr:hypothetical protein [Stylosanthes scabra]
MILSETKRGCAKEKTFRRRANVEDSFSVPQIWGLRGCAKEKTFRRRANVEDSLSGPTDLGLSLG